MNLKGKIGALKKRSMGLGMLPGLDPMTHVDRLKRGLFGDDEDGADGKGTGEARKQKPEFKGPEAGDMRRRFQAFRNRHKSRRLKSAEEVSDLKNTPPPPPKTDEPKV